MKGLSMRKLKEVLRLHYACNLGQHKIAESLNMSSSSVNKYLRDFKESGLKYPVSDEELLKLLSRKSSSKPELDYAKVYQELKRSKSMTLQRIYDEYIEESLTKLSYVQFTRQYNKWLKKQPSSMKQNHVAGDKVFVDYAGPTVAVIDAETAQVREAQIFVGVLGASNYIYVEATWSQQLPDWIGAHQRMFETFNGVPSLVVPDNLRSAVSKACLYEPDLNPAYAEFIRHYGCAVFPARAYKPKDKSKAEGGVLIVERWLLMAIRNKEFHGLAELNTELKKLAAIANNKPFKKLPGTRQVAFENIDKPALKPLPATKYEFRRYKKSRVRGDYHVELENHYYSVPYEYVGHEVDIWYNEHSVSIYAYLKCIANHIRHHAHGNTSNLEHMPERHRKKAEWTEERCKDWAKTIGISTLYIVEELLKTKHSEHAKRSCMGFMSLAKKYGEERLESACSYAVQVGARTRRQLLSILENNLDKSTIVESDMPTIIHDNLRGADYYV